MDQVRGFGEDRGDIADTPAAVGNDERRMHVRAYNHWVSLLGGRAFPAIDRLVPDEIADFGAHSVLIDFTQGSDDPAVAFLGHALRDECGVGAVTRIAAAPADSLLARLGGHYPQLLASRAPVGFEAEFVNARGHVTMYRGILLPFSSRGDAIDFVYGVVNWKELVDGAMQASLEAEVSAAIRAAPPAVAAPAPVWADGPGAEPIAAAAAPAFPQLLAEAQTRAGEAEALDRRARAGWHAALGAAHDLAVAAVADPDGYAAILDQARVAVPARAPLLAVAKLAFGAGAAPARLARAAAVLAHAAREQVPAGTLSQYLAATDGGAAAIVAAERARRHSHKG